MLNFYPWGLSLNVVQPLGPAGAFSAACRRRRAPRLGAGGALDEVELQTRRSMQTVQRGIRSPLLRGRYAPAHGGGNFNRPIGEFAGSAPAGDC